MRNAIFRQVGDTLVIGLLAALVAAGFVMNATSGANEQPFRGWWNPRRAG
jgi:hypothetical protein